MAAPSSSERRSGRLDRFNGWMYRGGRPHRLARFLNRMWALVFATGLVMPSRLATLEVRGRSTGRVFSLPVVIAEYEGERYLVAMLGEYADWVRNARASDGRVILRHGRRESVQLVEVEVGSRAPILKRYLAVAAGARAHIPVDREAPLAEFERIAPEVPVFRITSDRD